MQRMQSHRRQSLTHSMYSTTGGSSDDSMAADDGADEIDPEHRSSEYAEQNHRQEEDNRDEGYQPEHHHTYKTEDHLLPVDVADRLVKHTEDRVKELLQQSPFVNRLCSFDVPRFSHQDFQVGDMIARGGFAVIYDIAYFWTGCELNEDENEDKRYVLKHLSPKLIHQFMNSDDQNNSKLVGGAKDLVMEAHILSALQHPNVIALRGLSSSGINGYKSSGGRADGFFFVLDKLTMTLSKKIFTYWKGTVDPSLLPVKRKSLDVTALRNGDCGMDDGVIKKYDCPCIKNKANDGHRCRLNRMDALMDCKAVRDFLHDRLDVALDVGKAIEYLHEHNILHRDIKPANIGFDVDGVVKLFDFGLAVEVPPPEKSNSLYDLTGNTGTPRFMAPEVIKRKPYNFKADVYSYTILLWEIISLDKPYDSMDGDLVREKVGHKNERPELPPDWPKHFYKLFKRGWAKKIDERFSMAEMNECIRSLIQAPMEMPTLLEKKQTSFMGGKRLFRGRASI